MTLKRFVIRKSLIGKNEVITFTNKKGEVVKYNHDDVYNTHKDSFESMNCFRNISRILIQIVYQHSAAI